MADIWGKQLYYVNKLNHKLQAHVRVCEENEEKNDCQLKYFAVKGLILEICRRTVALLIEANFTTKILHSIKVTVQ